MIRTQENLIRRMCEGGRLHQAEDGCYCLREQGHDTPVLDLVVARLLQLNLIEPKEVYVLVGEGEAKAVDG